MTIESGRRRIVAGVDGSAESVAALRWACREASLGAAEVVAVLALEAACHQVANYAVPAPRSSAGSWGAARDVLHRSVMEASLIFPKVSVRTEISEGLAARVLLDHASRADLLVLGRTAYGPDPYRAAGPVIRACLRASACPVVVIGSAPSDLSAPSDPSAPSAPSDRKAPSDALSAGTPQISPRPADHMPGSWRRYLEGTGATR